MHPRLRAARNGRLIVYARAHARTLTFLLFLTLVCLRMPYVVLHGRFWAEEGRIYFVNAWNLPPWQALWQPANGYLSLASNISGLLAAYLVPLAYAPHVTFLAALALQSLPALLLITARDSWLQSPLVRLCAILLLALPPVSDEVWLNTPNSQFHIALAAALILVLHPPANRWSTHLRALALLLAPLSSPAAIALTPLFIARAAIERTSARLIQAASITLGTVLQLGVFYTPMAARQHPLTPVTALCILAVKHLAIPFLGQSRAINIATHISQAVAAGHTPHLALLVTLAAITLFVLALALCRHAAPIWLCLAGIAIASLSYYGALGGGPLLITVIGGNRYAFAPHMLFALGLLSLAATAPHRLSKAAWALTTWLLIISLTQFRITTNHAYAAGPNWAKQVKAWHKNPTQPLAIWPPGWTITLSPKP